MRNSEYFQNKNITIVGLARSGFACAKLLSSVGAQVSVTDNQDNSSTRAYAKELSLKNIDFELGRHTKAYIENRDIVVISPGVSELSQAIIWARENKIPVISEIEVASLLCPATIIAVTGSNGKTTVTTLIGKIIEASGKKVFVCGNIGNPFSGEIEKMKSGDFVSLEISSFQLENIRLFKPKISLILNFTPNHLDRYCDMQEYLAAKKRIFMNQDISDYLVLNQNDSVLCGLSAEAKAKVIFFSQNRQINTNQAAVLAVAEILGINQEICMEVFSNFRGIEHRLEFVSEINKIKFINDSKATTVDSCVWALDNINAPVILIAGGKDKGVDYSVILGRARGKVKEVILIGQAKEKIKKALEGYLVIDEAETLEGAVAKAYQKAKAGDCVLLSPMCASFDMFSNYEERGRVFKKAVHELIARSGLITR